MNNAKDIAIVSIQREETCARRRPDGLFEAYPDAYSDLGKAMRRRGLWTRYIAGLVEIPADLQGLSGAPYTIGWGQTGRHVFKGVVWTQQECDAALAAEVDMIEAAIRKYLLKREPTVHQMAAFISFAYNVGLDIDQDTRAEGLGDSTLLKKFNRGDIQGAADAFLSWVYAGGERSNGLIKRRGRERQIFLGANP